jgi:hypothetical protein
MRGRYGSRDGRVYKRRDEMLENGQLAGLEARRQKGTSVISL